MQLIDGVYLIGSGLNGMNMTNPYDCHIYLIDGGDELAVVDIGAGMAIDKILDNITSHGYSTNKIEYLILTHAHADHAGGAREFVNKTGAKVIAPRIGADYLQTGDEKAISLQVAKEAGIYPMDYQFQACDVDRVVSEGDVIKVGKYTLEVIETPGHCSGHASFIMNTPTKTCLFAGDVVFYQGKILVQYIHDCNVFDYGISIKKLGNRHIDCLMAGHDTIVLNDGQQHINMAIEKLKGLGMPSSLF